MSVHTRNDVEHEEIYLVEHEEIYYVEINLQKKKWLLCCSYNPNKNTIKSHIEILHKGLALYSSKYENFIVLGDFNVGMDNSDMTVFCDTYDLKCLIKEPCML